ncbi:serine hydrolase [Hymenobacter properus]|uniref:Serine hydrolase n=1 Tax=Hymenobacter properus TaxID=2791026 RepID=A0A931BCB1_9BACT|nr:serine hydrolase [Hymenobacter properus]MBF9141230.1 serine hydrolase [Hymenobacter properus]MBR7720039.1 serine hydrolase [Microvirga sp. SRT04]
MKNIFRPATAGLLLLGVLAAPALMAQTVASAPQAAIAPASMAQQLDDYVHQFEKSGRFMGTVLVADHGQVVLQKGYGLANREKGLANTPNTKFRIGSLSKQFTAALVLQLVEKGKLKLDGHVADYLPDYPQPAGGQITLHQLLSHTAGLPNYTAQPTFATTVMRTPHTPTQLVSLFSTLPLEFAPGTQYHYSNSGYVLLGAIIEKVTGKPYAQVFQENVAGPLKLKATSVDVQEPADARRATGYEATASGMETAPALDMSVPYAAGAITSTATDLYHWSQALEGNKVLSETSKKLLFTPVKNHYAYGWIVYKAKVGAEVDTILVQEHNGAINGFSSYLVRVPQSQQVIVLLDNHAGESLAELKRGLLRILHHQPATPPVAATMAADASTLGAYVGVYELAPTFRITVRQRDGRLFVQATGQSEFETEAMSPVLFALKGVPAEVEFSKNDKGQVAQLILHQGGHDQPAPKVE